MLGHLDLKEEDSPSPASTSGLAKLVQASPTNSSSAITYESPLSIDSAFVLGLESVRERRIFVDCVVASSRSPSPPESPAHRIILSAYSSVLRDQLTSLGGASPLRGVQRVELDIDPKILELVLDFMYTGRIILTDAIVMEVFAAARSLAMTELQTLCEQHLSSHISKQNVLALLVDAHAHKAEFLRLECLRVIAANIDEMFTTQLEALEHLPKACLADVLREDFKMDEHRVFRLVRSWGLLRQEELRAQGVVPLPHLREILDGVTELIRFVSLKKKFLKSEVMPLEILPEDMFVQILFAKAQDPAHLVAVSDPEQDKSGRRRSSLSEIDGLRPYWLRRRAIAWKTLADFDSEDDYSEYLRRVLRPGMLLKAVNTYEAVREGDVGEFLQWNTGFPPCQCRWRDYENTYWLHWRDVVIFDE